MKKSFFVYLKCLFVIVTLKKKFYNVQNLIFGIMMKTNKEKEAYKLRFEYYNFYENKEFKWHEKYKKHDLYDVVVKSFNYRFHEIGKIMPKIIEDYKK